MRISRKIQNNICMYSILPYIINKYPQCRVLKLDVPEGIFLFPSEIRTSCDGLAAEKAACAVGFCHPSTPQASLLFPSKLGSLLEDAALSYKPCFGCIFSLSKALFSS